LQRMKAGLYLIATPIGNLDDISLRALDVMRNVDLILAEDTRHTRKLLNHFDTGAALKSLHEHNEARQAETLAERLAAGDCMALVSDAGTPLISDPGHNVVQAAISHGVAVIPVPGPSSVMAALTGSGLPLDRFTFLGYLPRKRGARMRLFASVVDYAETLVMLESPRRVARSAADALEVFGPRPACVARELTKVHEEYIRGNLADIVERLAAEEVRGEVVLCIAGAPDAPAADVDDLDRDALQRRLDELTSAGTPRNQALKQVAAEHSARRRDLYRLLMIENEEKD